MRRRTGRRYAPRAVPSPAAHPTPPAPTAPAPAPTDRVLAAVFPARQAGKAWPLVETFTRLHPEAAVVALVTDLARAVLTDVHPRCHVVGPGEVGVGRDALHLLALVHDEDGLVAALRPRLLAWLLDRGHPSVLCFDTADTNTERADTDTDADTDGDTDGAGRTAVEVVEPLTALFEGAEAHGVAIGPGPVVAVALGPMARPHLELAAGPRPFAPAPSLARLAERVQQRGLGSPPPDLTGPIRWRRTPADDPSPTPTPPYGWARTAASVRLTPSVRRLVRRALARGGSPPPDPWHGDGGAFTAWVQEETPEVGQDVSRFVHETWRSWPGAAEAFADPADPRLRRWARFDARLLAAEPPQLLPALADDERAPLPGVNLVGYLRGDFGVGEAGRMVSRAVAASGLPLSTVTIRPGVQRHDAAFLDPGLDPAFALNLLAVNPHGVFDLVADQAYAPLLASRPNVGMWYWEVDRFPAELAAAFDLVDEVWCASAYVAAVLAPLTDKPVRQHPLVVTPGDPRPRLRRADLGLPEDTFLFGFAFDHLSVFERKNPLGVVAAYREAFGPHDGTALVLKSINGAQFPGDAARVEEAVADRPDIVVIDRHLTGVEMRALMAHLDAFVSLHRSEGLGLGLLDAMALGKPVVATAHSGNMSFMDETTAALVPFRLVEVGPGRDPYPADARWAEPDLDAAAAALRQLVAEPARRRALGQRARRSVAAHTPERAGAWFAARYAELVP